MYKNKFRTESVALGEISGGNCLGTFVQLID